METNTPDSGVSKNSQRAESVSTKGSNPFPLFTINICGVLVLCERTGTGRVELPWPMLPYQKESRKKGATGGC